MSEEIEYERVAKKQKTYISFLKGEIDNLIEKIENYKISLSQQSLKESSPKILKDLKSTMKVVQQTHKEFNSTLSKLGKAIDRVI